jgi:hypothetical protein
VLFNQLNGRIISSRRYKINFYYITMDRPLSRDHMNEIIKSCVKSHFDGIRSQLDGLHIEMKVIREEDKKFSWAWEVEVTKQRLCILEN